MDSDELQRLRSMRVSALKDILKERHVSTEGVLEKNDLIDLIARSSGRAGSSQGEHFSSRGEQARSSRRERSSSSHGSASERARRDEQGTRHFLRLAEAAEVLGVSIDSSDEVTRAAQKRLLVEWHPDRHSDNAEQASSKFTAVKTAYELLMSVPHAKRVAALKTAKKVRIGPGSCSCHLLQPYARTISRTQRHAARAQRSARRAAEELAERQWAEEQQQAEERAAAKREAAAAEAANQPRDASAHTPRKVAASRDRSVRAPQFQDILAAAARESSSRSVNEAPQPMTMARYAPGTVPMATPVAYAPQPIAMGRPVHHVRGGNYVV